jgi:Protein of unknown function (DUF3800)
MNLARPEFTGEGGGSCFLVLPHTTVRVVYSDETGTGSIEKEPFTVVAAILLNMDSQWREVLQDITAIKPLLREFKGRQLYRDIRSGRHREEADSILTQILAIPRRRHLPIFYGAVNRATFRVWAKQVSSLNPPALPSLHSEVASAFDHCMDKIDNYVHTLLPGEQVLWIADKSQYEQLLKDGQFWFDIWKGVDWKNLGLGFETEPHKAHIVDTIYFGDSRDSRALQLADICCSTINLHLRKVGYVEPYYELLRSQVVSESEPSVV